MRYLRRAIELICIVCDKPYTKVATEAAIPKTGPVAKTYNRALLFLGGDKSCVEEPNNPIFEKGGMMVGGKAILTCRA